MRVAMPVFHPSSPGTILLRPGVELDRELITRMVELRVRHLWIEYPALELVSEYVDPRVAAAQGEVTCQIEHAFDAASLGVSAELDFDRYASAVGGLLQTLMESNRSQVFLEDLVSSGRPVVRHASSVCYLSVLTGLKLGFYLEEQRSRIPPSMARQTESLGVGAMLHDVGMPRLDPELTRAWRETGDDDDPRWRAHGMLGFSMGRGHVEPSAAAVVLHHHQRVDGTGYPAREKLDGSFEPLSGGQIHVFARIVHAVDLFDRLTNPFKRGRRPMTRVAALRAMLQDPHRGGIDPVVFGALLEVCPPYTPGSMVRLNDGRRAVVCGWSAKDPCRPLVCPMAEEIADWASSKPAKVIDLREQEGLWVREADGQDVSNDNFTAADVRRYDLRAIRRGLVNRAGELLRQEALRNGVRVPERPDRAAS